MQIDEPEQVAYLLLSTPRAAWGIKGREITVVGIDFIGDHRCIPHQKSRLSFASHPGSREGTVFLVSAQGIEALS
jgi:hypothetical protein